MEGLIAQESILVNQKLRSNKTKANAKNLIGLVLYHAFQNIAIRVSCGAASVDKHNSYPITCFHIRFLCYNQNIWINTLDLLDQCTNDTLV